MSADDNNNTLGKRAFLERRLRDAFSNVSAPSGWEGFAKNEFTTVQQCRDALTILVRAQVDWGYYALPRLLMGALNYPNDDIISDILVALDVEMKKEDGKTDPQFEHAKKLKLAHFSKLTSEQRGAIAAWLKFVEATCAPPWRIESLRSAISYWST